MASSNPQITAAISARQIYPKLIVEVFRPIKAE
jgi:hypothetical protein